MKTNILVKQAIKHKVSANAISQEYVVKRINRVKSNLLILEYAISSNWVI